MFWGHLGSFLTMSPECGMPQFGETRLSPGETRASSTPALDDNPLGCSGIFCGPGSAEEGRMWEMECPRMVPLLRAAFPDEASMLAYREIRDGDTWSHPSPLSPWS